MRRVLDILALISLVLVPVASLKGHRERGALLRCGNVYVRSFELGWRLPLPFA